jgi:hypothetical protein
MAVAIEVNSAPVDKSELASFTAFGEEFIAPAACIGCAVLNAKKNGEAIGMFVKKKPEEYYPEHKIPELRDILVQRADDAVSGACRFILQQSCWRVEQVEEKDGREEI